MEHLITVRGSANISVSPDIIIVSMDLDSHRYSYEETMELAAGSIVAIEKAVKSVGFDEKRLKTTSFNINTKYKSYYDEKDKYKSVFDGYVCEQRLKLQFDLDTELLSKVLLAIAESDVNPKLNIRFSVKDKEAVCEELIIKATENARKKAEIITKASRANLGKIVSIEYDWSEINVYSHTSYEMQSEGLLMKEAHAPHITPDDIDVSDTICFVWEIK